MSSTGDERGIVGAGGAGFPTHVKLQARAQTVIVNAAECEPLLYKDKEVLRLHPDQVLAGMRAAARAVGAAEAVVAIKEKYTEVIETLAPRLAPGERLHLLRDYYPAGDEFLLVFEVTGRIVPPGGLPLAVGAVVSNVETMYNLAAPAPVTHKFVTVAGAVRRPQTLRVPIGTPVARLLAEAGGATVAEFGVVLGGVMMGRLARECGESVTKTLGGVIVLPRDHVLLARHARTEETTRRIGAAACDQCCYCTELCPRYLLGHPVEPHRAMRTLGFCADPELHLTGTLYCCECNLCSLISCPEDLDPKGACVIGKRRARERAGKWSGDPAALAAHPLASFRKVPLERLMRRLDLVRFAAKAPLAGAEIEPDEVVIPLKQHVGVEAAPTVTPGDPVARGQLVGRVPEGELGAAVHASIAGRVVAVDRAVTIRRATS